MTFATFICDISKGIGDFFTDASSKDLHNRIKAEQVAEIAFQSRQTTNLARMPVIRSLDKQ